MRDSKPVAGIVAIVLTLMISTAMAQGPGAKPDAGNPESSFTGVVVSVNLAAMTVKGALDSPDPTAGQSGGSSKGTTRPRSVPFLIKGAKITRGGWRLCEWKDIEKGATVTVTFTPPTQRGARFVASRIDIAEDLSAERRPLLGEVGKLLFGDDFSRSEMPPKWRLGKGFWEIRDGVVTAAKNPDDQPVAYLKSEGVDHPTKNMVGFTIGGKSAQLDNLRVWAATARSAWSKDRSAVQAALQKQ